MGDMGLEISRREVLNNLVRFKDALSELREDRERRDQQFGEHQESKRRRYRVLLSRKSGDMRFAEKIARLEWHIAQKKARQAPLDEWKEVEIVVHDEHPQSGIVFEVVDAHAQPLVPSEFEPLAWRVAGETLEVLNFKGSQVRQLSKERLPEEEVLRDLSMIHMAPHPRIEELPGWVGPLTRFEAEMRLIGRAPGTYLLREGDQITLAMTSRIGEENHVPLRAYVLTVVEKEGKIADKMLLQTNKGWTIYEDEPDLSSLKYRYFSTPQALIKEMQDTARTPFLP